MAITANISGLKDLEKKLSKLSKATEDTTANEINNSAINIMRNAKRNVVVDNGFLRNSISFEPLSKLTYTVEAKAKYAPYVEFGTGGLVTIPSGYEQYAAIFKGKGIRKVNLRARPFLIPAFENEIPQLMKRLNSLFNA
jgi:HK97 gp10 family phage protein